MKSGNLENGVPTIRAVLMRIAHYMGNAGRLVLGSKA